MHGNTARESASGDLRRVLVFAEGATLSHILRPAVLAAGLDRTRFDLWFACQRRFHPLVEGHGFNMVELHSQDSRDFLSNLSDAKPLFSEELLTDYIHEDLALIDTLQPDVVVGDLRLSLSASSELRDIPYVNITNAHWSPMFRGPYTVPDIPLSRRFPLPLAKILFKAVRPVVFAAHTRPLNRARRAFGLDSLGLDLKHIYTAADHTLYCDHADHYEFPSLPENHRFIGPVLCSIDQPLPQWWKETPDGRPVVAVSMGSSGDVAILDTVLASLARLEVTVIAVTAGRKDIDSIPGRLFVADRLPAVELAARADLFVTNGGTTTVQICMSEGTPVLAIPSNMDQYLSVQPFVTSGAALYLRSDVVSETELMETVTTMLEHRSFRESAERCQEMYMGIDAREEFSRVIDQVTENRRNMQSARARQVESDGGLADGNARSRRHSGVS